MLTDKNVLISSVIILFLLFSPQSAQGQGCCTPGSSTLGGIERGASSYKFLTVNFGYQDNAVDEAFNSNQLIADPLGRRANVNVIALEIEYGIVQNASLMTSSSYTMKSREQNLIASNNSIERIYHQGNGFGDITILGKYQLVTPTITSPLEISIGGGAKLPVGNYKQEKDGSRLAIDLQVGTGASDLLSWAYILHHFPSMRLRVFANILFRYPGMNLDGYRFGDETLPTIGSQYTFSEYLGVSFLLKGRIAKEDFSNGRVLTSTGGTTISVTPGFVYIDGNTTVRIYSQIPVHRNINGIQLTLSRLLGMEYQYGFSLQNNEP